MESARVLGASPHNLSNLMLEVRLHTDVEHTRPEEPPSRRCQIYLTGLLKPEFQLIPTAEVRCRHLSFRLFLDCLQRGLEVDLDLTRDKLGFVKPPLHGDLEEQFIHIRSELTFHNAISLLQHLTRSDGQYERLVLHAFSPAPTPAQSTRKDPVAATPPLPQGTTRVETPIENDENQGQTIRGSGSRAFIEPSPTPSPSQEIAVVGKVPTGDDESQRQSGDSARPRASIEPSPTPSPSQEIAVVGKVTTGDDKSQRRSVDGARPRASVEPSLIPDQDARRLGSAEPDTFSMDWATLLRSVADEDLPAEGQREGESDEEYQFRAAQEKEETMERRQRQLTARLENKVCEQLDEAKWALTCAFFHHDVRSQFVNTPVAIHGLARKLLPCQAHSVVRTLLSHHGPAYHCFHAHAMGIGKSTIAIATCHVQHLINLIHAEITAYPAKHIQGNLSANVCPSAQDIYSRFGLDCPCTKNSPTHFVRPSLGINVIIAPLGLLSNWHQEWRQCYNDPGDGSMRQSNPFRMCVAIAHGNTKPATDGFLTNEKIDLLRGRRRDDEAGPTWEPRATNSQVLCITTSHSYQNQLVDKLVLRTTSQRARLTTRGSEYKNGAMESVTTRHLTFTVASFWRDEAHLECLPTSSTLNLLNRDYQETGIGRRTHITAMSGTLLTTGPLDIAAYLARMARSSWKRDEVLRDWRGEEATELGNDWSRALKLGKADESTILDVVETLRPLIERLVHRFTPETIFLGGGPVVTLPPHHYREVACQNPPEWTAKLATQKEEEDKEAAVAEARRRRLYLKAHRGNADGYVPLRTEGAGFHYRSRLCASLPYLLDLMKAEDGPTKLTEHEWTQHRTEWVEEADPYLQHIQEIYQSSGKLQKIVRLLAEFQNAVLPCGRPAPVILCSWFFAGTRVLYHFMTRILGIPAAQVVYLHQQLPRAKIDQALREFHNADGEPDPPRYIVAQTSAFGVGLTLSEVVAIILLEPDYKVATEIQLFARHDRQGNKNTVTHSILLYAEGNEREERIRIKNHARKRIHGAMERVVKVAENGPV